jgi:hypothetical protein
LPQLQHRQATLCFVRIATSSLGFTRLFSAGLALAVAGGLSLSGCNQVSETVQNAATSTGQAALAPAVNPVLDLLRQGKRDVKAGNMSTAIATMGGFQAIWDQAAPVIRPLAGDKWSTIETAANLVLKTFASGASPDANAASSAISGLMGPLSALIGK